jgi:hypothetical protein
MLVVMLSGVMLTVIVLRVLTPILLLVCGIILSAAMLKVVVLIVLMLCVGMLTLVVPNLALSSNWYFG